MAFKDEVSSKIDATLGLSWDPRKGEKVPSTDTVKLAGGLVELDATFLYADLVGSTGLVRDHPQRTAAKVLRCFIESMVLVVRQCGGEIRSFDGDRVMGVFVGGTKNTDAARCALKMNHVVLKLLRPKITAHFKSIRDSGFKMTHCVGIDTGPTAVVRAGARNANDLLWVSEAASYAAKLSDLRETPYHSFLSKAAFDVMMDDVKISSDGREMWESRSWTRDGATKTVYRSSWTWAL